MFDLEEAIREAIEDPLRDLTPYWKSRILNRVRCRLQKDEKVLWEISQGRQKKAAHELKRIAVEARRELIRPVK